MIANTMKMYSRELQLIDSPNAEQCASANFQINHNLLHDIILTEAQAYTMKYTANKRREANFTKNSLQLKIDEIQNSIDEDDRERLKNRKDCLDDLERKEQEDAALKLLAKYIIEGEGPTKLFCQLAKKLCVPLSLTLL